MTVAGLHARDGEVLRACLRALRSAVPFPVLFGGFHADGETVLSELLGTRTPGMRGLRVRGSTGLGGRVAAEGKPRAVLNYATARSITHDYDGPVLTEGIGALLALPVRVHGTPRAIVYVGTRSRGRIGDRVISHAWPIVTAFADEIRVRDEVDRRLDALAAPAPPATGRDLEQLRQAGAELRCIAAATGDAELAARIRVVSRRLQAVMNPGPAPATVRLAPREIDVLSLVALGCGNAEIGQRLCIGTETVRSYLRNAMRKLDAHSRLETVVAARRLGLII